MSEKTNDTTTSVPMTTVYKCKRCNRDNMTYGQIFQHLRKKHKIIEMKEGVTYTSRQEPWKPQIVWKEP